MRERGGDIVLLAEKLFERIAGGKPFEASAMHIVESLAPFLAQHAWPGNVRELENVMERAAVLLGTSGAFDTSADIARAISDDEDVLAAPANKAEVLDLVQSRNRVRLLQVIGQCDGNLSLAAKQLGISRSTLWRRLKQT